MLLQGLARMKRFSNRQNFCIPDLSIQNNLKINEKIARLENFFNKIRKNYKNLNEVQRKEIGKLSSLLLLLCSKKLKKPYFFKWDNFDYIGYGLCGSKKRKIKFKINRAGNYLIGKAEYVDVVANYVGNFCGAQASNCSARIKKGGNNIFAQSFHCHLKADFIRDNCGFQSFMSKFSVKKARNNFLAQSFASIGVLKKLEKRGGWQASRS